MNISQAVARVYAKALFDIGMAEGTLGEIFDDLKGIQAVADSSPEAQVFFESPKLRRSDKKRMFTEIFGDKVNKAVLGLMHVLVDKRREPVFDNVIQEFQKYRDEHEGRVHARVTTAQPLPDDQRERLAGVLSKVTGKSVDIEERVRPEVIGGIRVNLGDFVMDGTILRQLKDLRRSFAAEQG
ncbi:MAG: ATP synthase F1 subunit delta [Planctomycetota bacterium]